MAWPRRGDCGPRDLAIISLLSLRSFVDCRVPRALEGAIEADGISRETEPEADSEVARDLSSRELLLSRRWPRRRERGRRKWRCERGQAGGFKAKVPQEAAREPAACREAEAVRQDGTQQPAGADEEGGSRLDVRGGCATKGDARRRRCDKRRHDNQRGVDKQRLRLRQS